MSPSKIPSHYVTRFDAKTAVGKSPKTIYRTIRLAIEAGDEKAKTLLPHCKLQLKDGEVIDGNAVESMQQIDQLRRAGRYPMWWLDPEEFAAYFSPRIRGKAAGSSNPEAGVKPASKPSSSESEVLQQMQARLDEKDERIGELKTDKQFYREHVDTLGEHLERITGLLSHAQLQALGLPEGFQHNTPLIEDGKKPDRIVNEFAIINVDDTVKQSKENEKEGIPQEKTVASGKQKKKGAKKQSGATTKKRKTATKTKPAGKKRPVANRKTKKAKRSTWSDKHLPNVKRLFSRS